MIFWAHTFLKSAEMCLFHHFLPHTLTEGFPKKATLSTRRNSGYTRSIRLNQHQLLDGDGIGERVQPGAAFFLRERDTQQAHLAQLGHDVSRETTLLLVLVDLVRHLAGEEVADRLAQELVLWGEVEVHEPSG